jgi:hypothetical protein
LLIVKAKSKRRYTKIGDVHWRLPTTFIEIGSIIGIGRFGSPKVLPIFTRYKIYMFLCALEAFNDFLLELKVLLELKELEVSNFQCTSLPKITTCISVTIPIAL